MSKIVPLAFGLQEDRSEFKPGRPTDRCGFEPQHINAVKARALPKLSILSTMFNLLVMGRGTLL
ncbi:MAG TPA: hypothetical protein VI727_09855 [Candidatus Brocadiaceae bacterium]|nr:hypothetical protein [Candidatus Brocadiaceae bacterium]